MIAYIYHITNQVNGKKYIGKTINLKHRLEDHISRLSNHKHHSTKLQRAVDKYGWDNFRISYQEVQCKDDEELNLLEQKEIAKYDSYNNGYNETWGGDGNQTIFSFEQAVLIHAITKKYRGVNRSIARYFNCDHSVIDDLSKNNVYDQVSYDEKEYYELVKKLNLKEENLVENYVPHNSRKLDEKACHAILSVALRKKGYDNLLADAFDIDSIYRLKKGIVYKDYVASYNKMSEEEQEALCEETIKKYDLECKRAVAMRKQVKNALTQEQVNYILDNKDKKKRVEIAVDLGISSDRVGSVILGKSYKDLVSNYYNNCRG